MQEEVFIRCRGCNNLIPVANNQARRHYCDNCRPTPQEVGKKYGGRPPKNGKGATP